MKKIYFLSYLIFFYTTSLLAQDMSPDNWTENNADTELILPVNPNSTITNPMQIARGKLSIIKSADYSSSYNSGKEDILRIKVSDSNYDFFAIRNATGGDGRFIPAIYGHNQTDNRISLSFGTSTTPSNDYGNEPLLKFDGRLYMNGETEEGALSVQNRNLCSWTNLNIVKMALSANGYLGIGTNTPQAQLHTTGTVRFNGIPSSTGNALLMGDGLGNISRYNLPANSLMAFATNTPVPNSLPRFNASNVLVNSQIFDDGTNIGIGGNPATNARVTVYGVVNTLSDMRFKTNIQPVKNALELLKSINGYFYNWQKNQFNLGSEPEIGLLAQEVAKVLPQAVSKNQEGTMFLNYNAIIPVLTEALKEQQQIISDQQRNMDFLKNELKEMKMMLLELKK